jgi:hypothetical protein
MSKETGRQGGMWDTHYDILRFVAAHRKCTNRQVMEFHGSDPRGYVRKLRADGYIDGAESVGITQYWITSAGTRLLNTIDGAGEIAGPRQPVTSGRYMGETWKLRPGSEPSHGYTRPMIIASKVQVMKGTTL